jgi:hypothetical protein
MDLAGNLTLPPHHLVAAADGSAGLVSRPALKAPLSVLLHSEPLISDRSDRRPRAVKCQRDKHHAGPGLCGRTCC